MTVAGRKSASPPFCRELPKVSLGSIAIQQRPGVLSEGMGAQEGMRRARAGTIQGKIWNLSDQIQRSDCPEAASCSEETRSATAKGKEKKKGS